MQRKRLYSQLDDGLQRNLILISAPAGFGKTSLLSDWLAQRTAPIAWLSLDVDDNNETIFLTYLITALQQVESELGAASGLLLQASPAPDIQTILFALLNDFQKLEKPIILVLDDYHIVHTEPIHELVLFIIEHQPAQLKLILTSRSDPPWPLARLRSRGQLAEIRTDDLRFSPTEVSDYLTNNLNLKLVSEDIESLEAHTEGWIAGLQMAALAMQNEADLHKFITSFAGTHRFIRDYLTEEVFNLQPEATREFILTTSILDRFCAPLCNALTQSDTSQEILETLLQSNIFLVPLDDQYTWFRYHHMFSDYLRAKSAGSAELNLRASAWFRSNQFYPDAIKHAITAGSYETAAQLAQEKASEILASGKIHTFLHWVEKIPASLISSNPQLSLYIALAKFLHGDIQGAEKAFFDAEIAIKRYIGEDAESIHAELDAIRLSVSVERGSSPQDVTLAKSLLEKIPPDNSFLRSALLYTLGDTYREIGDYESAANAFTQSRQIAIQNDNPFSALAAGYEIAGVLIEQGYLQRAEDLHQESIQTIESRAGKDAPLPVLGGAYIGLGIIHYRRNNLVKARQMLKKGIALAEQRGGLGMARHGWLVMAFVELADGNKKIARQNLLKAESLARNSVRSNAYAQFMTEKVRFWLLEGNLKAATRWTKEKIKDTNLSEAEQIAVARVSLAKGSSEASALILGHLEDVRLILETQGRNNLLNECLLLIAMLHHANQQPTKALDALENCISLTMPENHIRLFVDAGKAVFELLGLAIREGVSPEYARELLNMLQDGKNFVQPLIDPLSPRELEVLALITAGATNAEISVQLVIAVGTVKRHTLSIYQKLGVNSRTQAVARARELNLS